MMLTFKGLLTAFAGGIPFARPSVPASAHASRRAASDKIAHSAPIRMTPAQQWEKVSGVLSTAIASATNAKELQAGAAQQLDLATYALYNLFDDLAAVMSEPLVREAASVHRLPSKTRRAQAPALAA